MRTGPYSVTLLLGTGSFGSSNVADTKHSLVKLLYEGKEVASWRLLEEDDPDLGTKEQMLRRVAEDPFAQAVFTDHAKALLAALRWRVLGRRPRVLGWSGCELEEAGFVRRAASFFWPGGDAGQGWAACAYQRVVPARHEGLGPGPA